MKLVLFATLIAGLLSSLTFASIDIQDRIKTQNFFKQAYPIVFGQKINHPTEHPRTKKEVLQEKEMALTNRFVEKVNSLKKNQKKKVYNLIKELDSVLPEKILRPLAYYKYVNPDVKKVEVVLSYYMFYKILILRDHIDNPLSENIPSALETLKFLCDDKNISTQTIYSSCYAGIMEKAKYVSDIKELPTFIDIIKNNTIIKTDLSHLVRNINDYSLSALGIIPGNIVEVVSKNDTSMERLDWLNERYMFNGGLFDFDADYIKMPTENDPTGHIIFEENGDPIYKRIREMIDRAEDSIFIDIFLFGGTLGMTLSEYLLDECIKKIKANPNFRLYILHDYATNYNMVSEMLPVFKYIRDRLANEAIFKGKGFLIQANIHRHTPGIPFGLTNLVINGVRELKGEKFNKAFKALEDRNTYIESKIDHSKVIVVDANTNEPEAYFGSKNWTDHSGGYYYDNAIYVKGPAAALVQASYYDDIDAALTTDKEEQKWFYYKNRDGGSYDNMKYLKFRKEILLSFKITRDNYPEIGKEPLRIAEANVDGSIKNVRNILIDMIKSAKHNIFMEQLFIYDPYINDALIKRKIEVPSLDIRILADSNSNFGLNGLPNTLFIKEMQQYGIQVRARVLLGKHHQFNENFAREYHQENHRKITSVDGKVLLGGSSNLNPDTLQGSFREFGAQIWDKSEIQKFEAGFERSWNSPEEAMDFDIDNFQVKYKDKYLSPELSEIINNLGAAIYRNKDRLENRY